MAFGVLDNVVGKSQFFGNGKGVALTGDSDEKPVGGAQRLHAELAAGVLHARLCQGKYLQLAVVGGGHGAALHVVEEGQNSHCQSGSLRRICSGSQLVKQAQGAGICLPQNGHNVRHVGREGTETLLNALLVSNVGKYIVKDSQLRAVKGRNVEARLSHESKQAHSF